MKLLRSGLLSAFVFLATALSLAAAESFFVFARINDSVGPIDRGTKYEDPLTDALEKAKLGTVTGGGSQLGADHKIVWIGIDIELVNLDSAVEFTRKKLMALGAPKGSVLQFERKGKTVVVTIHDNDKPIPE